MLFFQFLFFFSSFSLISSLEELLLIGSYSSLLPTLSLSSNGSISSLISTSSSSFSNPSWLLINQKKTILYTTNENDNFNSKYSGSISAFEMTYKENKEENIPEISYTLLNT